VRKHLVEIREYGAQQATVFAIFHLLLDRLAELAFVLKKENREYGDEYSKRIMNENVTIWDDGHDPHGLPMPFDFEGVPKEKLTLINNGVAENVVYDSYTAKRVGKQSTGHAMPSPNTIGPIPMHLHLQPGDATLDDMLRSTKRGILVTRFWYTRTVHPLTVQVTGMTRDGCFLIENGEITRPIKNMRFTQSYLEAMNNIEMIGKDSKYLRNWNGSYSVPTVKIAKWNFTSTTEY
jgi:predicted Zn-dependent protease